MKKIFLLLLQASLVLTMGKGLYAQNLVADGSFSTSSNWTYFAPGYYIEAYYPESSYGGSSSTNTVAEIDAEANLRQENIAVIPGQPYMLSFRYSRRDDWDVPTPCIINVKLYDGASVYVDQDISASNSSFNWQCQTIPFTPTSNTITIDFANVNNYTTLGMVLDDITIAATDQPIVLSGQSCKGGNVTLTAPENNPPNSVYSNYSWTGPGGFTSTANPINLYNVQAAQSGTYTCTMTLNECMQLSGTFVLNVNPTTFTRNVSICDGEVYDFYGRYLITPGVYDTLIPAGSNGCDSTIILNLSVSEAPNLSLNKEGYIHMCAGNRDVLRVAQTSGSTYQWFESNNAIPGATTDSLVVQNAGHYSVQVTTNKGCKGMSQLIHLSIDPIPSVKIQTLEKQDFCAMDTLRLRAVASGDNLEYYWSPDTYFRPLTTNQYSEVKAIIPESGYVKVTVYSGNLCSASDSVFVKVHPCCEIGMPNAFTPNGDGRNDYFKPILQVGQTIVSFRIYNRLGQLIYENNNERNTGWDGTFRGKRVDNGVYMYQLNYNCSDGQNYFRKGDFTIIK